MSAFCFLVIHIEPVLFEHGDGRPRSLQQKVIFSGREPEQFQIFLQFRVGQNGFVLFLKTGSLRRTAGPAASDAENAGAEDAEASR